MHNYRPAIDFHAHFIPECYLELLRRHGVAKPDDYPLPFWSEQEQLESMDDLGIEYAVCTLSSPHVSIGLPEEAVRVAHAVNIEGAGLAEKYPDRIGLAASLPLPDVRESLREIDFCINELKVKGFAWPTHAKGAYLGNPELDPLLERINAAGLPVIVHPTTPTAYPTNVNRGLPIPVVEFFFESTRTMMNMFLNRTLHKFPDIAFVFPHAGACMPLITERVQGVVDLPETPFPDVDVLGDLKKLYFDIMGVAEDKRLKALLEIADGTHILYGSDNPHAPMHVRHRSRRYLEDTELISDELKTKICTENGKQLLGL